MSQRQPRLRVEDYTIGWVCALPVELAAAVEMLDEEHDDLILPQDATDTNMYSLGRIGEHNVVIACLPAGLTGTSSAMAVASQMMSKFVSIKLGLMVGIGGGVPSTESDIRLGDVVISHPHMQHGGVVQYDFGKAGVSGQFTRTGFLNAPPIVLLNTVSRFRSNYLRHKGKLEEHLSTIVTRLPQFAATKAGPDILFEPDYNHTPGSTCDNCNKDRLVERTWRLNEEIVVHYGTIASGNQVIKDGMTRDRLSMELGGAVLCFEMEAAGLMNNFPCLVIRGICDYADSHKNKKWQPYAAATAAACAKELLSMIPGTEVAKKSNINDETIVTDKAPTLGSEIQGAYKYCLDMLFLTNPYDDRAKLINTKGQRVEGTCDWVKDDFLFRSWLNPGSQLLWITGGPGKGKTMLSIYLTEELAETVKRLKDTDLIFYFCDYQDEKRNTATDILRGLLYQILEKRPKLFKSICEEFETDKKALYTISSFEAIWRILESVLRDPDLGTIYCVIDGLDECDEDSLPMLITKLTVFFQGYHCSPTAGEFKLVTISRELPRLITTKLSRFPRLQLDPDAEEQVNSDIKRFISVKVDELSVIEGFSAEIRALIEKTLLERAEGTFLWVGFVTNELLQMETCTGIVETLSILPRGLPGIYSRMLLQINEDRRSVAASILRWVIIALRPLTLAELTAAISARPISYLSSDQVIQDLLRSCGAFIKVTKGRVGLVHQSARDYLVRKEPDDNTILEHFRINQEKANYELARACLNYIQIEEVSHALIDVENTSHLEQFPLSEYAALSWPEHARRCADLGKNLFNLSGPFFRDESPMLKNWWLWYRTRTLSRWQTPEIFSLLHLASYLGMFQLLRKLLAKRTKDARFQNIQNERDNSGKTALLYAAQYGNKAIVQQLLASKADVNAKDIYGRTVLHYAAKGRNKEIMQQLLASKADVNAKNIDGRTALHYAAGDRNKEMVQQLIASKAHINAKDNDGWTALHYTARGGNTEVMQQLLASKVDVNAKDNDGWTALHYAARDGHTEVIQQLLASKADVNAKDNMGQTALDLAVIEAHTVIEKLLESAQ